MTPCAKCHPELHSPGMPLGLCATCWKGWGRGVSLEQYLRKETLPQPPRPKKIPYAYKERP